MVDTGANYVGKEGSPMMVNRWAVDACTPITAAMRLGEIELSTQVTNRSLLGEGPRER